MSSSSSDDNPFKKGGIKKKYDTSTNKASYQSKSLPYAKHNLTTNSQASVTKFRKSYKDISPDAQMIVDQIIDPEMQMSVTRVPTYGVSSTYTAHNIIQAAYDANAVSMVAVYPALRNSIFATYGGVFDQVLSSDIPYGTQLVQVTGTSPSTWFDEPIYFANNHVLLPRPSTATSAMIYAISHAGPVVTAPLTINFHVDVPPAGALLNISVFRYNASLAVISGTTVSPDASGNASIVLFGNAANAGTKYLSISFDLVPGSAPYVGTAQVSFQDPTGVEAQGIEVGNVSQHCLAYALNGSGTIGSSAESYFVSAQSCLLTYEGSDLNSGGRLAIARVPQDSVVGEAGGAGSNPIFDSWYDWIASLSRNSYNGRVKTGGYSFYLGQDERSYFYRPVEEVNPPSLPYIVAEWSTEVEAPQAVRIMVTTVIQFTTNSNVYDQKPSPYLGEDWCKVLHMMSCINASYDNPGHRAKLTAALKKVGSKVLALLKDPKTYATIGSIVAALA